jgi:hypothetical protein
VIIKKWYIGATINIKYKIFQNISFENSSLRKHVFLDKRTPKKTCKVNTLACYISFGP